MKNIVIYRPTCRDAMFISVLVRHSWNTDHTMSAVAQFVQPFNAAVTPENIRLAVDTAVSTTDIFAKHPDAVIADVEVMTYTVTPRQQVAYGF